MGLWHRAEGRPSYPSSFQECFLKTFFYWATGNMAVGGWLRPREWAVWGRQVDAAWAGDDTDGRGGHLRDGETTWRRGAKTASGREHSDNSDSSATGKQGEVAAKNHSQRLLGCFCFVTLAWAMPWPARLLYATRWQQWATNNVASTRKCFYFCSILSKWTLKIDKVCY